VNSSRIARIVARQILDSRGRPTVETDVHLEDGSFGRASAPSGASTGRHEAHELRDGVAADFGGRGVTRAVASVTGEIATSLAGFDARDQRGADDLLRRLDGTENLKRLGANAVLATSLAVARAAADNAGQPLHRYIASLGGGHPMSLPLPMTNILSGGAHAGRAMDFQDFLAIPIGATSLLEAISMLARIRQSASDVLSEEGRTILLADEGGLSPGYSRAEEALNLMMRTIEHAGLNPGKDVAIALDVAATELFADGKYVLKGEGKTYDGEGMAAFIADLCARFPIVSVEDPLAEDDWTAWQKFTAAVPVQIVGDDLFVTNPKRVAEGIAKGAANGVLIKLNQNGTLTGTLDAIAAARSAGYATVVSARSGETEDAFMSDFAVGTGAGQIKIGSLRSSERLAKYNQLLRISEDAGIPYVGAATLGGSYR
jgi:enolase